MQCLLSSRSGEADKRPYWICRQVGGHVIRVVSVTVGDYCVGVGRVKVVLYAERMCRGRSSVCSGFVRTYVPGC